MVKRYTLKLRGGALLGEGSKGIVYDLKSNDKSANFFHILSGRADDVSGITLYGPSGKHALGAGEVSEFVKFIGTKSDRIAKIIKNRIFRPLRITTSTGVKTIQRQLDDEIWTNLRLLKLLGQTKFLSIDPQLKFNNTTFIACAIKSKSGARPMYVIFGKKCKEIQGAINLDKLILDVLECLVAMKHSKINHNDIKPANIMVCGGRYKLIDWGNATFGAKTRSCLFAGPLNNYLKGYSKTTVIQHMDEDFTRKFPELLEAAAFKRVYERIVAEFNMLAQQSRTYLFANYTGNSDLFAFGLTICSIVVHEGLDENKYAAFIDMLTSYVNQISLDDAMNFAKYTFNSGKNNLTPH